MRLGQIPAFSHWPTWLQASINQQRKEATWALLQMQQRRSLGLPMPVAKASSRSNSQLWHKGTLEIRLPKSPSRDLDIPSWSRAGILQPSSAQPPWTHHWRLKMPRAPVPDSHHLYGAQGNSYSGREANLLSHWHRGHLVCYACLLRKNQGLSGLCYEGWQINIYATNNQASNLHTSRYPHFPILFSYSQNAPLLFLGETFSQNSKPLLLSQAHPLI